MKSLRILYYEIKEKIFNIRYRKLKKCKLPYHFYDNKRRTDEWISYKNGTYQREKLLEYALEDLVNYNLIYHFEAKIMSTENIIVTHRHNFDEVIENLYCNPETFKIPNEFLGEYSTQQLNYLKKIQEYLNMIGLKDFKNNPNYDNLIQKYEELYKNKENPINKIKLYFIDKKLYKLHKSELIKRCNNFRVED